MNLILINIRKLHLRFQTIIIISFLFINCAFSANFNDQSDLHKINKQISIVKTEIEKQKKKQLIIKKNLVYTKNKLNFVESKYSKTKKQIADKKYAIHKLSSYKDTQLSNLNNIQQNVALQLQYIYEFERIGGLQKWFNNENDFNTDLFLIYHEHILNLYAEQLRDINKKLFQIDQNKYIFQKQTSILSGLEKNQFLQKLKLHKIKQQETKTLKSLHSNLEAQSSKLNRLIAAKRNLDKLISSLSRKKGVIVPRGLMLKLCSNFRWPTDRGKVIIHFGSPIEQSSWTWSGVIIDSSFDHKVRAISPGKIVYSGWFKGYGLLLIIDHGHNYMSLYGQNKFLHKNINDIVSMGDVIATAGSGDYEKPGLYFAIRYQGKPVNPESWCR